MEQQLAAEPALSRNHLVALVMAKRGFRVLPCWEVQGPNPANKVKSPRNPGGHLSASQNVNQINSWWARWPNALVGLDLPTAGLFVVDADRHGGPDGVAEWKAIAGLWGDVGPDTVPHVSTPSHGLHVYFRRPPGMAPSNRTGGLPTGIDVRGAGYTIAPGCVLPDGRVYLPLERAVPLALGIPHAPDWLVTLIGAETQQQERHSATPLVPWDGEAELLLARKAVDAHEGAVEGAGGDKATYELACRLRAFGVSQSVAFDLMSGAWNDKCAPAWSLEELSDKVGNAYRYGQGAPGAQSPTLGYGDLRLDALSEGPRTTLHGRLVRQGDAIPHGTWLLKPLIPRVGTALLVAPSGAGKSSVALQLAKSLSTGTQFFGKLGKERCATLILAAEGWGGLQARLNVLSLEGGLPIYALRLGSLAIEAAFQAMVVDITEVAALCQSEHGLRLGLIIVDTLAASGFLTNENDNSECAAAIKKLERVAVDLECLVAATHHSPKSGTDPRGGSALAAGVDVILTVARNGQAAARTLHCTKSRDSLEGPLGTFTLIPEVVGLDPEGDEVTACAVSMREGVAPVSATPIRLPPTLDEIAQIQALIDEGAPDGLPWRFSYSSYDDGDNWAGVVVGDVMGFVAQAAEERSTAQTILNGMIADGRLAKGDRKDPTAPKNSQRKPVPFVKLP